MSLAYLGKMEPFRGEYTFSKNFMSGVECNFTLKKKNIREEGQMRSRGGEDGGWGVGGWKGVLF